MARAQDRELARLVERFVCVRAVQMRGIDLSTFQFDFDQTWAVFFLNADGTVYGRYGTRAGSGAEKAAEVTLEGLRRAMEGALEIHAGWPAAKDSLAGKRGPKPPAERPEGLGPLKDARYEQPLPKGCIHCHNVWEGWRAETRPRDGPVPDEWLWLYPMPDDVGLDLDPKERATVEAVAKGSAAEKAGFRAGDRILELEGQPILSQADVQWVLWRAPPSGTLAAKVARGKEEKTLSLALAEGWRRKGSFDGRASSWPLRPGLKLDPATGADRARLPRRSVGLVAKFVGPNREAAKAGLRAGDLLVAVDGRTDPMTPDEFTAYLYQSKRKGEAVRLEVLRGRKEVAIDLPAP